MKKFMAILATILVMALSVTSVFAAPSAEVSAGVTVTTESGAAVEVTGVMFSDSEYLDAVNAAFEVIRATTDLTEISLFIVETLDVSAPAGWDGMPVILTFELDSIAAGDNVVVVCQDGVTGSWEGCPVTVTGDGYVKVLFTHFCPVMIATYEEYAPAPNPSVPEVDSPSVDNTKPGGSWWYDEIDSPSVDNSTSVGKPTPEQLKEAGIENAVTPKKLTSDDELNKIEEKFNAGEISESVYNVLVRDIRTLETEGSNEDKLRLQNDFVAKSGKNVKEIKESEVIYIDAEVDPVNGTWVELVGLEKIQVRPGMNLIVSHQRIDGVWEDIEVKIVGNTAYGKFYSLSTVNVMEVELEPASWYYDPAIDGPVDPSTSVSPKTADTGMALWGAMLAVAACGAMVLKTRKAN